MDYRNSAMRMLIRRATALLVAPPLRGTLISTEVVDLWVLL